MPREHLTFGDVDAGSRRCFSAFAQQRKDTETLTLASCPQSLCREEDKHQFSCAAVQMRIRIPPLSRRRRTASVDQNVNFTVKQAIAGDLGLTEDAANWPINYSSYTSEDAFCDALNARATTDIITVPNGIVAHTLTLQPFTKPASTGNEDRHTVQYWDLPSGQWTFVGVFDGAYDNTVAACHPNLGSSCHVGHSGHEASEHAVQSLPSLIRSHLERVLASDPNPTPSTIGDSFSETIQNFDKSFEDDLKAVIPENFESLSDRELQALINDHATGGRVYTKVIRCMRGACSAIAVIDPAKENLWIVNLGDCEAGQYLTRTCANAQLTRMISVSTWGKGIVRKSRSLYLNFNTQHHDRCGEGEDQRRSSWGRRSNAQQSRPGCLRTHPWCVAPLSYFYQLGNLIIVDVAQPSVIIFSNCPQRTRKRYS